MRPARSAARLTGSRLVAPYTRLVDRLVTSDPLVGQVLDGRYLMGAKIARGGMASVYEATDLRLDRLVAVKVMPQALADDESFSQRFVREARAAARLTHPNVVAVYDQGEDAGVLFLAMEYVAGRHTLRDVIRAEAPLSPSRALSVLEEILKAIAAAHEAGIVHRDVKPENVLIDPRGQIKVADFGLARAISSATSATATGGVLMGTVSYLPPELVTDGNADARSDVYALGVLLFELLTGRKPHVGDSPIQVAYKHVHDDVPAPSAFVDGIAPYLDAFVARATSRDRDLRPADAHVMLQQLRRVRHALDRGVIDDQELTDDLTPTILVRGDEATNVLEGLPGARDERTWPDPETSTSTDVVTRTVAGPPPYPAPSTLARRRKRRGWIAFVVVLLLAAGAAAAGWYYGVGRFRPTPDVVRLSQSQARSTIVQAGLSFRVAGTAYSEKVRQGGVISTEPRAGEQVLRDGTVSAVISKGPERHRVPELAGLSEARAVKAITNHALVVGHTARRWDEDVRTGEVVAFTPKQGTELRRDQRVSIVVSKGPAPIKVADHTGQSGDSAVRDLQSLGLKVKRDERYDDNVADGLVISQRPSTGVRHSGDTVTLVVSRGPPSRPGTRRQPLRHPGSQGRDGGRRFPCRDRAGAALLRPRLHRGPDTGGRPVGTARVHRHAQGRLTNPCHTTLQLAG